MRPLRLFVLLALISGCSKGPYFSDDEGGARKGGTLTGHPDELSLPYALGTTVRIVVKEGDPSALASWRLVSDDPTRLSVDESRVEERELHTTCTARGEGETRLRLVDGTGRELRVAAVTVRTPDRARAFAHGPLRVLGREASKLAATEVTEARVLAGGKGVFGIAYYRGMERLYGRGIAAPESAPDVRVEVAPSSGAPVNEWLFVSPANPGTSELRVRAAGALALTLPVVAVPEAEIGAIALREETPASRADRQQIWVLAQAVDRGGRDVHGLYATWTLDGVAQTGDAMKTEGDLFRYEHRPGGAMQELAATRGALAASTRVSAYKGQLHDTTYLGCALGGRGAPGPVLAVGLLLLAGALRRRARRP